MTVCYCQILCMCFNNLVFARWEELCGCALPEDGWLKNEGVKALDQLDIKRW